MVQEYHPSIWDFRQSMIRVKCVINFIGSLKVVNVFFFLIMSNFDYYNNFLKIKKTNFAWNIAIIQEEMQNLAIA